MRDETAETRPAAAGRRSDFDRNAGSPHPVPRRVVLTLDGHGEAVASTEERVLVALERAQGFGRLRGMPRRLPVGCRRGGCGICRMRVLNGDYRVTPMSRAHVSEADEADGVVLACAIYALTDLTLRLETPILGKEKGRTAEKTRGGKD